MSSASMTSLFAEITATGRSSAISNGDVIRQELASEHGIVIGLRSVELRVQRWRRELKAQKRATVRFETAPGRQLQIDFGDIRPCSRITA